MTQEQMDTMYERSPVFHWDEDGFLGDDWMFQALMDHQYFQWISDYV
jgi:hypothetical protein